MLKYTYSLYSELTNNYEPKQNHSNILASKEFFLQRPHLSPKSSKEKVNLTIIEEKYLKQPAEKEVQTNKELQLKFRHQLDKLKKYRGDSKQKTYLFQVEETGDPSILSARKSIDIKVAQRLKMKEHPLFVNRILAQRKSINNEISFRIYNRLEEQRAKSGKKTQENLYLGVSQNPESPKKKVVKQNIPFISSARAEAYISSLNKIQKKINYQLSKVCTNEF